MTTGTTMKWKLLVDPWVHFDSIYFVATFCAYRKPGYIMGLGFPKGISLKNPLFNILQNDFPSQVQYSNYKKDGKTWKGKRRTCAPANLDYAAHQIPHRYGWNSVAMWLLSSRTLNHTVCMVCICPIETSWSGITLQWILSWRNKICDTS